MNTNERVIVHIDLPQGVALFRLFGALRSSGYAVRCTGPAQYSVEAPERRSCATVRQLRSTSPEAA